MQKQITKLINEFNKGEWNKQKAEKLFKLPEKSQIEIIDKLTNTDALNSILTNFKKTHKINTTNKKLGWVQAREEVEKNGGLPSNLVQDEYLVTTENYKKLPKEYYPAWAREVSVYLKPGEKFKKEDIIDQEKDEKGRNWVLPEKYIPKDAIGKENIQLFIDPQTVEVTKDKVIIHPKTTKVLTIPEKDGWYDYDEQTRMPINKKPRSDQQKRYLFRRSTTSIRPLARYDDFVSVVDRRFVDANGRRDYMLGVGWESQSEPEQ